MTEKFKKLLDGYYDFPCTYIFKFVLPQDKLEELKEVFDRDELTLRESSKGNYVSATIEKYVISSDEVLSLYEQCAEIEGLIKL